MNQVEGMRGRIAQSLVAQHHLKGSEGFVLRRSGSAHRIVPAFERRLGNQRVGRLEPIEIVARILRAQLSRQRRGFRKSLFARVQNNQQRLGFVVHPAAFFGHAFQRRQPAFFRSMKAGNASHDLQGQAERTDRVIVETDGEFRVAI